VKNFVFIVLLYAALLFPCRIEQAKTEYAKGVASWNGSNIEAALKNIEGCNDPSASKEVFLLKALSFWRLTVFSYVNNNKKAIRNYASLTEENALKLEKLSGVGEISTALKAFAYQMLSSLGITTAIKNGPKSSEMLNILEKSYPNSYWTRIVKSINLLQAPKFAGGNTAIALEELNKMKHDYPDSSLVAIHLSMAFSKNGLKDYATKEIVQLIAKEPGNRWAIKVKEELQ
jgi:hypothetical protein